MAETSGRGADEAFRRWTRRPTLMAANGLYLIAAAALIALGVGLPLLSSALSGAGLPLPAGALQSVNALIFYGGAIVLPVVLLIRRAPGVESCMRLSAPSLPMAVLAVAAAVVGVLFSSALGTLWLLLIEGLGGRLSQSAIAIPAGPLGLTLALLTNGALPGVCEELLFRGALLGAWERRGTRYALAVVTLLFATLHGSIEGLPVQLLVGLAMGYLVVNSGSVYTGMIYHTVHNCMLVWVSAQGPAEHVARSESLYSTLGGMAGVGLTFTQLLLFGALYALLLGLSGLRRRREGRPFEQMARVDRSRMGWQELIVLASGLVTVGALYLMDFLSICGVL